MFHRIHKLKAVTGGTETIVEPKTANPFTPRPSSASLTQKPSNVSCISSEMMSELDNPSHMPDGVESNQWDRLVASRHKKVDSELKVSTINYSFHFI